ncbi:MAG TPA: aminoglycoside 6-adenylyltransferase [Flavitalea sp.]|nr:aminoglycoside 6-adenylyltransferase [Flavitalea sp.]
MKKEDAITKIISWASQRENIQVLLLSGSLANAVRADDLSDIDLAVFGYDFNFIENDQWLSEIGSPCVCIHDHFNFEQHTIPSRLTIFSKGLKIDFSFHPLEIIERMVENGYLPNDYNNGYKILLDKTGLTNNLPEPDLKGFRLLMPDAAQFKKNENEFWFEIYHIAKYLKRNDVWAAKSREGHAKVCLLKVLEWGQGLKSNWQFSPKQEGRGLQTWLDADQMEQLSECFSAYDLTENWTALNHLIRFYRFQTEKTAANLGMIYNKALDQSISDFVNSLQLEMHKG